MENISRAAIAKRSPFDVENRLAQLTRRYLKRFQLSEPCF